MCNHEWGLKSDQLMKEIRELIERAEQHLQEYPGGNNGSTDTFATYLQSVKRQMLDSSTTN